MARGHRLNTSIVLAAVHGLSGLFRAVSAVEPITLALFPTLSPSLIGHPASVDVKQHKSKKTESSIPQRRLGDAPLHHQPHRYSRGTPQHRDVGTAPPPFSGWYGAHRHTLRRWAAPPPAVQLWSSPATWTSVYIRAHSPPFLQYTASQHRPAPPSHQLLGGCSGDTCVTQACSVCPAVCFNGSLFLYTPDWCVLVA